MAAVGKKDEMALALRALDWGPEARAALPSRRFSQDDITIGYGGLRINEKRFSVQLYGNAAHGGRSRPSPAVLLPVPPRRKRTSVVADASTVMATCSRGKGGVARTARPVDDVHHRRIVLVFLTIGVGILLISVLLVTVTLRLSPRIDEMVRKENEELLKILQSGSAGNNGIQDTTRANNSINSSVPRSSSTPTSPHLISEG